MSIQGFVLILLVIIAIFALVAVIVLIRSMFIATKGRIISTYAEPRKALVVMDIQEGYSGTNTRQPVTRHPATGMIATIRIAAVTSDARQPYSLMISCSTGVR